MSWVKPGAYILHRNMIDFDLYRVIVISILISLTCVPSLIFSQTEGGSGYVSYYADRFQGKKTASGETYDKNSFTAAHRSLPFGTMVRVSRLDNKKSVVVRINDRGPFVKGRIIDLSRAAARQLDIVQSGSVMVEVEVINLGDGSPQRPAAQKSSIRSTPARAITRPKPTTKLDSPEGLFYFNATVASKSGFGIQVAAYKELENVLERVSELRAQKHKDTMVHISQNKDGNTVYRLVIGSFGSREEAESYREKLAGEGIIIELSQLK